MGFAKAISFFKSNKKSKRKESYEQQRTEGQAQLRAILADPEGVDWGAVIEKASELHVEEERFIREEHFEREKRASSRRKRYEKKGSFASNLIPTLNRSEAHHGGLLSSIKRGSTSGGSTYSTLIDNESHASTISDSPPLVSIEGDHSD